MVVDGRYVALKLASFIPRIGVGVGKSWEEMPVREGERKTWASAPCGYACDDGTIRAAVVNEMDGEFRGSQGVEGLGRPLRTPPKPPAPYILRHPCLRER